MTKKTKVVVSLCTLGLAFGAIAATAVHSFSRFALATYDDRQPYTGVVMVYASDFSNGSGSITKNGNTFNYSGVTVDGETISIASGGSLSAAQNSGATSGATLMGAGFSKIGMTAASNFTAQVALNGVSTPIMLSADQYAEMPVNSKEFNFEITTGPVVAKSFAVMFECKSSEIVIDGLANEYIWDTEVMSKPVAVNNSSSYSTNVYAVKTLDGLYVYAEQHVAVQKHAGDGWWEIDNLECHFRSGTMFADRGLAADPQFWISADGRKSDNISQFVTTEYTLNPSTNLYDKNYELFITWASLGTSYYDKIVCLFGSNYNNGFVWGCDSLVETCWSQDTFKYQIVTSRGIEDFTYDPDVAYQELAATPVGGEGDGWNSALSVTRLNGNSSWGVKYTLHQARRNFDSDWLRDGFVAEVFSPDWANGGWTFEMDWWGWGRWNKTTNEGGEGIEGNCGNGNYSEVSGEWNQGLVLDATDDMDVEMVVRFNATSGLISVIAKYTSTAEGHAGQHIYISYTSRAIDYRGEMRVGVGYQNASVNITSIKLFEGSLAA